MSQLFQCRYAEEPERKCPSFSLGEDGTIQDSFAMVTAQPRNLKVLIKEFTFLSCKG